jgi:hypothetical protein
MARTCALIQALPIVTQPPFAANRRQRGRAAEHHEVAPTVASITVTSLATTTSDPRMVAVLDPNGTHDGHDIAIDVPGNRRRSRDHHDVRDRFVLAQLEVLPQPDDLASADA